MGLNLFQRKTKASLEPLGWDQLQEMMNSASGMYPLFNQTLLGDRETMAGSFGGLSRGALKGSAVVYACIHVRAAVFSQVRFQFRQRGSNGSSDFFGTPALRPLETPWPNGTTADLLARAEVDVSMGGNAYVARRGTDRFARLRPDWVDIMVGSNDDPEVAVYDIDAQIIGFVYWPGGRGSGEQPELLLPEEVAHYAPMPDPEARFRGMSWVTPVIREVMADKATTQHKLKFFENGAPQPLDAKVLTPTGWSTMGELDVGDRVIGRDGRGHDVLAVYPQGEQDVYQVTFSDGASTECTANHIWRVENYYDRKRGTARTMTLQQIMDESPVYPSGPAKFSVPYVDPVEFECDDELPLDPYLLGVLLGDGSFRSNGKGSGGVSLSAAREDADELVAAIAPLLPTENEITRRDRGGWSEFYFRGLGGPRPNPLTTLVRELELFDVAGRDKFIPEVYLRASIADRVALLQGLVDSDGHIEATQGSSVSITTTSSRLAVQIVDLVGGLGGSCSWHKSSSRSTMKVNIRRLPDWVVPCRLSRKVERYLPVQRVERHRFIVGIEPVGKKQAQCIAVDSLEHLYVTDDFVVTHNTPNMKVQMDISDPEKFQKWVDLFNDKHQGVGNHFKTLFLAQGMDAEVIGSNLNQIDFTKVQGGGEVRVAAAAGVPASIIGLAKSLEGAALNNEAKDSARRTFGDITLANLWQNFTGSIAHLIDVPGGAELAYDPRGVAFLKDDVKDAAASMQLQMATINTGVMAGFEPDAIVAAVAAGDIGLLKGKHTGLVSVQLLPPGTDLGGNDNSAGSANGHGNGNGSAALALFEPPKPPNVHVDVAAPVSHFHVPEGAFQMTVEAPEAPPAPDVTVENHSHSDPELVAAVMALADRPQIPTVVHEAPRPRKAVVHKNENGELTHVTYDDDLEDQE